MSDLLDEQKRYYAARAPEYDDWWYRRGRYELEPDALARWWDDVAEADAALEAFAPRGTVLELAAGGVAVLLERARRLARELAGRAAVPGKKHARVHLDGLVLRHHPHAILRWCCYAVTNA